MYIVQHKLIYLRFLLLQTRYSQCRANSCSVITIQRCLSRSKYTNRTFCFLVMGRNPHSCHYLARFLLPVFFSPSFLMLTVSLSHSWNSEPAWTKRHLDIAEDVNVLYHRTVDTFLCIRTIIHLLFTLHCG